MGNNDPNYYDATTGRMIDLDVLRSLFDDHLDGAYDPVETRLLGEGQHMSLDMSAFLKAADRGAYDQAFNDWLDAENRDGRLTVGPPEVEYQVVLDMGAITATSHDEAARKAAALLAGRGQDGYAWRAVYDVTGPDSTEHAIDLELVGSGRTCTACNGVDNDDAAMSEAGMCMREINGLPCGGNLVWKP